MVLLHHQLVLRPHSAQMALLLQLVLLVVMMVLLLLTTLLLLITHFTLGLRTWPPSTLLVLLLLFSLLWCSLSFHLVETPEVVEVNKADEGEGWFTNRKRARSSHEVVRRSEGSRGSGNTLSLSRQHHAANITLPRSQMKACVDSLKRARLASESAGALCGRASRAFL